MTRLCTGKRALWVILGLFLSFNTLSAQVTASFVVSDSLQCAPIYVTFTNTSVGATSYLWDYGDGSTFSTTSSQPVYHYYANAGLYEATLVAYLNGVAMDTASEWIEAFGPTAPGISVTNVEGCSPLTITFSIDSVGSSTWDNAYWLWDNGDTTYDWSGTYTFNESGYYFPQFVISDSQCMNYIWSGDTISVGMSDSCFSAEVTDILCLENQDGAIDLTVGFGQPPYTFAWSNGATTEDLTGLAAGTYSVTVTDALGNVQNDSFVVDVNGLGIMTSTVPALCDSTGGSATVTATGGVAPYSYSWTTGSTTDNSGPVGPGGYAVYVVDDSGCTDHEVVFVPAADSCYVTLSGRVYFDSDQDCVQDAGEVGLGVWVMLSNGFGTWTNVNGDYSIQVEPGVYTLSLAALNPSLSVLCPTGGTHTVTAGLNDISGLDFAVKADSAIQDLRVALYKHVIRPGFNHLYWLDVYNDGSVPMQGTMTWIHDSLVTYIGANVPHDTYDATTYTATWQVPLLQPGQWFWVDATGYIDPTVPLGTPITSFLQVDPITNDAEPGDNVDSCTAVVVGSYDPNDKLVSPAGSGENGDEVLLEEFDGTLTYTVRFQNTGTDTAFYVVIRDVLDEDLDPMSFQPATSSHPYALTIENGNELVFSFNNINLPDSARDLEGSNGHVQFRIKPKAEAAVGDVFENTAAIYFDFNAPIITNTVVTEITETLVNDLPARLASQIQLYPNPAQSTVTVEYENLKVSGLQLFTLSGQEVRTWSPQEGFASELSLEGIVPGMYFISIQTDQGTAHRSLIIK
ncbi:MAG: T9SS type A sorting domain-containing protein [Bacteroidota bacterium]